MRKISAHLICDGRGKIYSKGILTVDNYGTILDFEDTNGNLDERAGIEFYSGMIVPGFVNAHCHLELSHLTSSFTPGSGFVTFLKNVVSNRSNAPESVAVAAENADRRMYQEGIVAVGDISNKPDTFSLKSQSKIYYHTFVEVLGFTPERAEQCFEWGRKCVVEADSFNLISSIVPHAPYSVSEELFSCLSGEAVDKDSILSIHSQESLAEDELFRSGTGEMRSLLTENLGIDLSFFTPTGKSALRSTLPLLPSSNKLLLVHNVNSDQEDLDFILQSRSPGNTWFVLCPGSNLFIQNRLPDVELFRRNSLQICLGTDSMASNNQLSILEEMKILQNEFPLVYLEELVSWATYNGAKALGIDSWAGSLEIGKRPGLNLLSGMDLSAGKLLAESKVKKIV